MSTSEEEQNRRIKQLERITTIQSVTILILVVATLLEALRVFLS